MPVYEVAVSAPIPNSREPVKCELRVSGPYDHHRAKHEALQLAKRHPAFVEADMAKADVVITTRQSAEDYVAARRSKPIG